MKMISKPIFELLTGDIMIFNNIICNYIAILIIGEIAYKVAKSFVRKSYHRGEINEKAQNSIIHWLVRLIVYFICAYILRFIIWFINLVAIIPFWIWSVICLGVLLAVIIILILKSRNVGEKIE